MTAIAKRAPKYDGYSLSCTINTREIYSADNPMEGDSRLGKLLFWGLGILRWWEGEEEKIRRKSGREKLGDNDTNRVTS